MADYYTQSCTLVECPEGKEGIAIAWVDEMKTFTDEMRELKRTLEEDLDLEEGDVSWLADNVYGIKFMEGRNLLDFLNSTDSFNVEISRDTEVSGRISIHFLDNGEDIGIDYTASLIQSLLRALDSDKDVFMHWANTCSKHRSDSFSGGACLICKEDITFINVEDALKQLRHENRKCGANFTS